MNIKQLYTLFLLTACCLMAQAQHVNFGPLHSSDNPREDWLLPGDTLLQDGKKMIYKGKPVQNVLNTPTTSTTSTTEETGYGWGGTLHEGLNTSIGLSAFVTTGKHVPHRGGFTQDINLTYLSPLSKDKKLWMAAGGYLNNMNWGGDSYHDAGLYAMLGYRFNEHWEAYAYGQLSLTNNYSRLYTPYYYGYPYGGYGMYGPMSFNTMPLGYGMGTPGANVLGAGVRYSPNKNFSIGINIEGVWYDNHTPFFNRKYDYPVPKAPGE